LQAIDAGLSIFPGNIPTMTPINLNENLPGFPLDLSSSSSGNEDEDYQEDTQPRIPLSLFANTEEVNRESKRRKRKLKSPIKYDDNVIQDSIHNSPIHSFNYASEESL
jgi:hypothetical protein